MTPNGRYVGAFCNSFAIGAGNLVLFKLAPDASGSEIAGFLAGGPVGICLAMYLLRHLHRGQGSGFIAQQAAERRTALVDRSAVGERLDAQAGMVAAGDMQGDRGPC